MRGEWNGLQALFLKECPYAYYVHCFAHKLQLALVAAYREEKSVHQLFENLNFVINIVVGSSKSNDEFQSTQVAEIESVSILASFCVWTKSLMCKDAVNRDSTCQSIFRRLCTVKKIEDFRFPVSRPDDMSSRPNAHLSTIPSVRTTCSSRPDTKQTSIIRPDDVSFPSGPSTESRSFCSSLHPSGPLSSPSERPSVIDQLQILSKFRIWED
jgi:hypothetical protein